MNSCVEQPHWDRVSTFYSSVGPHWDFLMSQPIIKAIRQKESDFFNRYIHGDSRVLDIGCGSAESWRRAHFGASMYGIDFSTGMLESARTKADSSRVAFAQGIQLPFASCEFDVCVAQHVLSLFPDGQLSIGFREISRVTKEGGVFACCVFVPVVSVQSPSFPRMYPTYRDKERRAFERDINVLRDRNIYLSHARNVGLDYYESQELTQDSVLLSFIKR